MQHKRTRRAVALAVAGAALALLISAAASATPGPAKPVDDDGPCYDLYYDCGWASTETGVVTESPAFYDYSPQAAQGRCRTRWAARKQHNVAGGLQWSYYEQVRWCWNGSIVTHFRRDRWVGGTGYFWAWDGHVYSNCVVETCPGMVGNWSELAATQGHFHVCLGAILGIAFCRHKYPWITITVNANGTSSAYTSS
jgi:hypothetical protein